MPAQEEEIQSAEEEGIRILTLAAPIAFQGSEGRLGKVLCRRMSLGNFDESGRRKPVPREEDTFELDIDQALVAIGQRPDLSFLAREELLISKGGLVQIQMGTVTLAQGGRVFAGGDAVTGPATVIQAIAAGQKAAREIDAAIRKEKGEPPYSPSPEPALDIPWFLEEGSQTRPRGPLPQTPARERIKDFREVDQGLSPETAGLESSRCLRCDHKEI
jgi:NADH-quinone oxidoreductase subunit F